MSVYRAPPPLKKKEEAAKAGRRATAVGGARLSARSLSDAAFWREGRSGQEEGREEAEEWRGEERQGGRRSECSCSGDGSSSSRDGGCDVRLFPHGPPGQAAVTPGT